MVELGADDETGRQLVVELGADDEAGRQLMVELGAGDKMCVAGQCILLLDRLVSCDHLQSSKIFFLQKTQKNILICVYLENAFDG
jgi:hypothetical protein